MSDLVISKKVSLLGSWTVDALTDEIVQSIAVSAKTQKGKKLKVIVNETGIKLIRFRFLKENKTTFFPMKDLEIATRNSEDSRSVLFILFDSDTKHKIIALRCVSDSDALQLINICAEIQRKQQSGNVVLKNGDNFTWNLQEIYVHRLNRNSAEDFSEYKPNEELTTKIIGDLAHGGSVGHLAHGSEREGSNGYLEQGSESKGNDSHPENGSTSRNDDGHTIRSYHKGVYIKRSNAGNSTSDRIRRKLIDRENSEDGANKDYVIETEINPHAPTTYTSTGSSTSYRIPRKWIDSDNKEDGVTNEYVIETEIIPHAHTMQNKTGHTTGYTLQKKTADSHIRSSSDSINNYAFGSTILPHSYTKEGNYESSSYNTLTSKRVNGGKSRDSDNHFVIETEILPHPHTKVSSWPSKTEQRLSSRPSVNKYIRNETQTIQTQPHTTAQTQIRQTQINATNENYARQNMDEIERFRTTHRPVSNRDLKEVSNLQETRNFQIYTGQNVIPPRSTVYSSSSSVGGIPLQPVIYRAHPRTYETRMEYPVVYYGNTPTSHGRVPIQPDLVPVRVLRGTWNGKFDQRSLRSNNSKISQSRKSNKSHSSTAVVRTIEDTYMRPTVMYRPVSGQFIGYGQRPSLYPVLRAL